MKIFQWKNKLRIAIQTKNKKLGAPLKTIEIKFKKTK